MFYLLGSVVSNGVSFGDINEQVFDEAVDLVDYIGDEKGFSFSDERGIGV
jgi:hypothetical protein